MNCWKCLIQFPRGGSNWVMHILEERIVRCWRSTAVRHSWYSLLRRKPVLGWPGLGEIKSTLGFQVGTECFLRPTAWNWVIILPDKIWNLSPWYSIQEDKAIEISWKELGFSYYTSYPWLNDDYDTDQVSWGTQRVMISPYLNSNLQDSCVFFVLFCNRLEWIHIGTAMFYCQGFLFKYFRS